LNIRPINADSYQLIEFKPFSAFKLAYGLRCDSRSHRAKIAVKKADTFERNVSMHDLVRVDILLLGGLQGRCFNVA